MINPFLMSSGLWNDCALPFVLAGVLKCPHINNKNVFASAEIYLFQVGRGQHFCSHRLLQRIFAW